MTTSKSTTSRKMKKKHKSKSVTHEQKQLLIDFFHKHLKSCTKKFRPSLVKKKTQSLWLTITKKLNDSVGPKKTWVEWKKFYMFLLKMNSSRRYTKYEAKKLLESLFSPDPYDYLTVVKVLDNLKEIKSSTAKRKRNIFRCAIREIFEMTKYFWTYSVYQLMKIGHMFGGIIEYGLISKSKDLSEAYDFILEALKKSPDSNIFCFGLMALDRIKHLLTKHRKYCYEISKIPHNVFPSDLLKYINSSKNQQKIDVVQKSITTVLQKSPENQKSISINTVTTKPDAKTFVPLKSTTNNAIPSSEIVITNSVEAEQRSMGVTKSQYNDQTTIEPPENVQQKIVFIFDNMTQENMKDKCAEVKDVLKQLKYSYLLWFSVFLMKRICNTSQLHSLYLKFLECFNSAPFNKLIKLETMRSILKVWTLKDKSVHTKMLLQNLGHWLGLITLAKNKPLPFDVETMVLDALHVNGDDQLDYIIPFVTKILESCSESKVYGPQTPWTNSVLNCLAEVYLSPGMKFIFQLEIDLLCKTLNIELKELLMYRLMKLKYYDD